MQDIDFRKERENALKYGAIGMIVVIVASVIPAVWAASVADDGGYYALWAAYVAFGGIPVFMCTRRGWAPVIVSAVMAVSAFAILLPLAFSASPDTLWCLVASWIAGLAVAAFCEQRLSDEPAPANKDAKSE